LLEFIVSPLASVEELSTTHDRQYIHRFLTGNQTEAEQRNVGFPWSPQGVDRALSSVGGTVAAACFVCEQELEKQQRQRLNKSSAYHDKQVWTNATSWAAHVAGGTHHAFYDYGEGFSVFSDIAVAANVIIERYPTVVKNHILIVDLDVHQVNGNAVLFSEKKKVFTFSIHCSGNYFSPKQESDLDIELPIGCNDSTYLMTLHHWLKQFREQHEKGNFLIDLIIFQAGVDVMEADRLGRMSLSFEGVHRRNELVYKFAHNLKVPLVICMGGGYPKQIRKGYDDSDGWEEIIDAHSHVYIQAFQFIRSKQ
jgi:acetoin utilization deacetylase AcuC-like enzyme